MDMNDYQQAALRTANAALDDRDRLLDAAAGLAEEAGEVLGLIRKRVFQNRDAGQARLREELGDVLWCVAVTAHACGLSLDDVAGANVAKLKSRHPDGLATPRGPEDWSRSHKE
jgi:NTP pyrophosphatase (non-canonical NTP hydrolase)